MPVNQVSSGVLVIAVLTLGSLASLGMRASAFPDSARANGPWAVCDQAARRVASQGDVPLDVLMAVSRNETGRRVSGQLRPWPWTVNMEGVGTWFETEAAARAYVRRKLEDGARSFDVGCFQINYRWHATAFRSLQEMFDPASNARYAAKFLKRLHAELGDWEAAVGAYHSRTPELAGRYLARYRRILAQLPPEAAGPRPLLADRPVFISVADTFAEGNPPADNGKGRSGSLGSLASPDILALRPLTKESP